MNIKTIFRILVLWLLFFIQYIAVAESTHLNKIVVVVNSDVITQRDLDKRMILMKRQLGDVSNDAILRQKSLDNLINISLQLQLAKNNGIQVSDTELDGVIAGIAKDHNITLAKLKEILPEQEGVSFTEFRKQLREQILMSRIQQYSLGREISVSDKDIEEVLRNPPKIKNTTPQYHVVDILFEVTDSTAKDRVDTIVNVAKKMVVELQQGDNIDAIVKKGQDNLKEQIVKSDDLGWRKINEFPELFAKEVATMKVNQVVGPITAPNGLHLLKLLAIQGSSSSPSEKFTRAQAENIALHRKLSEKIEPWLKEMRKNAYIKIIN